MSGVKDVIQVEDRWYVLATSSRTDDRTRVLKHDELFGVFDRWGDIQHIGLGEQGLYFKGTRFLSRLELSVNDRRPLLLNSTIQEDNALVAVDLTLPDLYKDGDLTIRKGTVHLFRSKLLWQGQCFESLRLHNYGGREVAFELELAFEADYYDIFEVRGVHREKRGETLPIEHQGDTLTMGYRGLDGSVRLTRVGFNQVPDWHDAQTATARFACRLPPGGAKEFYLTVSCEIESREFASEVKYATALRSHRMMLRTRRTEQADVTTSNEQFNDWLNRSAADLRMLTTHTQWGDYPYAGIPWFSTPFGRDALITALQTLWLDPQLSRGVLGFLAAH